MIYDRIGAVCRYNVGEFRVGDMVVATPESPWEGLCGTITEIRTGSDRETENETPDIYCEFLPPVHPEEIRRLEARLAGLYGMEKRLDDISLDMVIMAPSMIRVIGRKDENRKLTVYLVREEWALDYDSGYEVRLCLDPDEAKMTMLTMIHEDMENGCIRRWLDREDLDCELKEDSYEYWLHDSYHENHYLVTLSTHELYIRDTAYEKISTGCLNDRLRADLAEQIEGWEELDDLTEEEYQAFISDPAIPEQLRTHLKRNANLEESYWESVSECAFHMLQAYRSRLGKPEI